MELRLRLKHFPSITAFGLQRPESHLSSTDNNVTLDLSRRNDGTIPHGRRGIRHEGLFNISPLVCRPYRWFYSWKLRTLVLSTRTHTVHSSVPKPRPRRLWSPLFNMSRVSTLLSIGFLSYLPYLVYRYKRSTKSTDRTCVGPWFCVLFSPSSSKMCWIFEIMIKLSTISLLLGNRSSGHWKLFEQINGINVSR